MKVTDLFHALSRPRAINDLGDMVALPGVAFAFFEGATWSKAIGVAGLVALFLSRFIRLAADLNGLGRSLRGHNAKQDQELEALKKDVAHMHPAGATAALLRSRAITGEHEVQK